jgi:hypothetical protein
LKGKCRTRDSTSNRLLTGSRSGHPFLAEDWCRNEAQGTNLDPHSQPVKDYRRVQRTGKEGRGSLILILPCSPNPEHGGHLIAHIRWVGGREKKKKYFVLPRESTGGGGLDKQVPTLYLLKSDPKVLPVGVGFEVRVHSHVVAACT